MAIGTIGAIASGLGGVSRAILGSSSSGEGGIDRMARANYGTENVNQQLEAEQASQLSGSDWLFAGITVFGVILIGLLVYFIVKGGRKR